jgi:hypothetical protein
MTSGIHSVEDIGQRTQNRISPNHARPTPTQQASNQNNPILELENPNADINDIQPFHLPSPFPPSRHEKEKLLDRRVSPSHHSPTRQIWKRTKGNRTEPEIDLGIYDAGRGFPRDEAGKLNEEDRTWS